ncbi:hypothetical protein MD484_g1713, partial [Candolleomyces efflorescens]
MSGKSAEYLPDSRKVDVEKINHWESNSTDLALCVHGSAGIGKSTLACHLSEEFRAAGRLAASVFLSVCLPRDAFGPETMIKMLAHEIGSIHPRTIPRIVSAMAQCHGTSLEVHLQEYIIGPLSSLDSPNPLVIIVDAIDEWPDHPAFLKALAHLNGHSAIVKFIMTSRFNPLTSSLPGINRISLHTYPLLPVSTKVIKAYFDKYLETVQWVDGRMARNSDIRRLSELSGGLPVWAATVVSLLSSPYSNLPPHDILTDILASRHQLGDSERLGELYHNALARIFPSPQAQKHSRQYLGAILVLQEPLSQSDFSSLANIPPHLVPRIQSALCVLQIRPPPPGLEKMVHPATTTFHLSFLEYVQGPTASGAFAVSVFESHSTVGLNCLKEVSELTSSQYGSLCSIQCYAIKYWPLHVSKGTSRLHDPWTSSGHCTILETMAADTQRLWATLFREELRGRWRVEESEKQAGECSDCEGEDKDGRQEGKQDELGEEGMAMIIKNLADSLDSGGSNQRLLQIACLEIAVRLNSGDGRVWSKLGRSYSAMGERTGSVRMFEEAVQIFRCATELLPVPNSDRARALDGLGTSLVSCFLHSRNTTFLHEAISLYRQALEPFPLSQLPESSALLNNLGSALLHLNQCNGDIKTLEEAASRYREALAACPDHSKYLNNLVNALQSIYEHNGDLGVLNEAITLEHTALALCPAHDPDRPNLLNTLANGLMALYGHNSDLSTLKNVISLGRQALALRPIPHPDRVELLITLPVALQSLFKQSGDIQVLHEALSLGREALSLCPVNHQHRPLLLDGLANVTLLSYEYTAQALHFRFQQHHDRDALRQSISFYCEAVKLLPKLHPDRSEILNNFGRALCSFYTHHSDASRVLLEEAISLHREALALHPAPHIQYPISLDNLAQALSCQVDKNDLKTIGVLDEAISYRLELLQHSATSRHRTDYVKKLLELLQIRFEATGDEKDHGIIKSLEDELTDLQKLSRT